FAVVLFDEIEKAHPDVSNLLLQILEDGQLTDAYGNLVDFKNSIVLMTSNIGSKLVLRGGRMGFGESDREASFQRLEEEILAELRRTFSPEFINRLDEVIVFNPLGEGELRRIVDIQLAEVNATLRQRGLRVEATPEAKDWLLTRAGVEPATGARPLRRTIQRYVQDAVSELLIAQQGEPIELIEVSLQGGELELRVLGSETVATEN
ncbi:MAG TPA: AAA family ATPase, partial [Thermoanaerobaculia bacterium]|nr:AAA family ATPase [Thermoanaerobaculia bacterium]